LAPLKFCSEEVPERASQRVVGLIVDGSTGTARVPIVVRRRSSQLHRARPHPKGRPSGNRIRLPTCGPRFRPVHDLGGEGRAAAATVAGLRGNLRSRETERSSICGRPVGRSLRGPPAVLHTRFWPQSNRERAGCLQLQPPPGKIRAHRLQRTRSGHPCHRISVRRLSLQRGSYRLITALWGVHLTGVSDLPPRAARRRSKLGGCPRCLGGFGGTQAAILPDAQSTGRQSRKAIAAIRGSLGGLQQSGTRPETPQGT
jgi:hypothetical protein